MLMIHFVLNIQTEHGVIQNFQNRLNLCGLIGGKVNISFKEMRIREYMKSLKRIILLITCVVFLLFMFGCNGKKGNSSVDNTDKQLNKVITGSANDSTSSNLNPNNDVNYTIKTKSIVTNNINVKYPQIVDFKDHKIQRDWNRVIKDKVEAEMNNIGSKDKYFLTYEVKTQNDDMISILVIGEVSCSANENNARMFKYTFNIDLDSGKSIRLKDKIDTEIIAQNLLEGRKYSLCDVEDSQFREYINLFYKNKKEIVDALNNFDFGESFSYTSGYSYYENGKIYICMSVNHQLGDYIEVLIDN